MKVTIEQVENGYLVTTDDGKVFVSTKLENDSYSSYRGVSLVSVLKDIFEAEPEKLKVAA